LAFGSSEAECRNPITGIDAGWAREADGQNSGDVAAALPKNVRNSRRFIKGSLPAAPLELVNARLHQPLKAGLSQTGCRR
jgi:hypothetical protein